MFASSDSRRNEAPLSGTHSDAGGETSNRRSTVWRGVAQSVPTVYLLAFAVVIPLTGWARNRFGAKPLWIAALLVFTSGSLLAGLSWSIGSLIAFRVDATAGMQDDATRRERDQA